jgi:DNA polymerase-3 subunit alpha
MFNKTGKYRFPSFKHLNQYNSARLQSISWIVADNKGDRVKQEYFIIKPLDFVIDNNSIATKIHGITQEVADDKGVPWHNMYDKFIDDLKDCNTLVAHNIQFDISIMLSEMYRYGKDEGITEMLQKERLCTMQSGKKAMGLKKNPKLSDLYKHFYNVEMTNAHDASADTLYCQQCLKSLLELEQLV